MGIDPSGTVVTIGKPYADMTPAEKDAANTFARAHPNGAAA